MTANTVMSRENTTPPAQPVENRSPNQGDAGTAGEPTAKDIIAQARTARASSRGVWMLSGLTAVLTWASFTPLDWGPLAWVCLVPLVLLVRLPQKTRWMYTAVFVCGLANALATLQWMRLGDASMYLPWFSLSLYLAMYLPVFVVLSRVAVHRFSVPLMLAVPAVWVGLEFARAHLLTGFSWYYLGHTQYRWLELIQICDIVGAYGVSFVVALTTAVLAGLVPRSFFAKFKLLPASSTRQAEPAPDPTARRRAVISVAVSLAVFGGVLAYGTVRRSQARFEPGPRIGLVQCNYTSSLKHDQNEWPDIFRRHDYLTGLAVKHQPDIIVWPETMFRWPLLVSSPELSDEQRRQLAPQIPDQMWKDPSVRRTLAAMSQRAQAALIIGLDTFHAVPGQLNHYNSAVFVTPERGLVARYDKLHRVIFGEYIPLRDELPWLHELTPFPRDFGIVAGRSVSVLTHGGWRLSPIICFEDTVPHLVRRIVSSTAETHPGSRPIDCLVNLTNDGWFHGSSELDQHLITAAFRCVECRTPMVRAVNTGVSAVIDGDGAIRDPEVFIDGDQQGRNTFRDPRTGRWRKQLNAVIVDTVPLDNRRSLYVRWGDWFAGGCGCFCLFLLVGAVLPGRLMNR